MSAFNLNQDLERRIKFTYSKRIEDIDQLSKGVDSYTTNQNAPDIDSLFQAASKFGNRRLNFAVYQFAMLTTGTENKRKLETERQKVLDEIERTKNFLIYGFEQ